MNTKSKWLLYSVVVSGTIAVATWHRQSICTFFREVYRSMSGEGCGVAIWSVVDLMDKVFRNAIELDEHQRIREVGQEERIRETLNQARERTLVKFRDMRISFDNLDRSEFLAMIVLDDDDVAASTLDHHYQILRTLLRSRVNMAPTNQNYIKQKVRIVDIDQDGLPSMQYGGERPLLFTFFDGRVCLIEGQSEEKLFLYLTLP